MRVLAAVDLTVVIVAGFGFLGTIATVVGQVIVKRLDAASARDARRLEDRLAELEEAKHDDR